MKYILSLLMFLCINSGLCADTKNVPPAYIINAGSGLMKAQGTAVSLRVYKKYGWFITATHVIKDGPSSIIIQGDKYPVRAMDHFRTTGLIPDGLTILRTVRKIPQDRLHTYLMEPSRQPKVGDKVWLLGYPSGRFQSKKTYVTQLIGDQFLTRDYLSFGASGGLVVYENGRLAGIIHGFAQTKGREGVHSNIALFASAINENYPFLIPRSQNDENRIGLHDQDDDHHRDKCDCGCEGCEGCNTGECPCEPSCDCDQDCACRVNRNKAPDNGAPEPPDQDSPIQEDPVDSTPLPPLQESDEAPSTEEPLKLEQKEVEEENRAYIDQEIKKLKEEIISAMKEINSKENSVATPVVPEPPVEPPVEPTPEIVPESSPEPPLVNPSPSGPKEKENVGILGNLISKSGWILPILGVSVPGGALGWLGVQGILSLARRRKRRKEGGDDTIPPLFRRDVTEAEQIIGLRQSEQREPIFDTMRGILFEDEFNANPNQSFEEAFATVNAKFNQIAPVAPQHPRVDTE